MISGNLIEIIDEGIKIEFERECIKNCDETADGISIQLATGLQIIHANYNMPTETKRTIVNGIRTFDKVKKIKINLRNYKSPVSLDNS